MPAQVVGELGGQGGAELAGNLVRQATPLGHSLHQLGRDVVGVGRAPPVPTHEQLPARSEGASKQIEGVAHSGQDRVQGGIPDPEGREALLSAGHRARPVPCDPARWKVLRP